ncbi:MAG: hypothetical protein ACRERU_13915 [Methylococcales bacterium]
MKLAQATNAHSIVALSLAFGLPFALLGVGCQVVQTAADIPSQMIRAVIPGLENDTAVDPVELQERLLRFADEFSAGMITNVAKLRRGENPIGPAEVLNWKIVFATEASSIATGPNAFTNLLDMTVFVTVVRTTVETHWQPNVYGDSARPLLETCRVFEKEIWELAGTVLKPEQQTELREAIVAWRQAHPIPENLFGARAVGLAQEVARTHQTGAPQSSVFTLLRLDPLTGLDPATRELAQTRLFAERALYITQWMPTLLRWQTELLTLNTMAMPEIQRLVTNSTLLAASVERFAGVVEKLPQQVSTEREELLRALQTQEKDLRILAAEIRQTITAGTRMSTSLHSTLITFDALMRRFGIGETNNASTPKTNTEPFRILDYAETAAQLEAAARQLTDLVRTLDQKLGATNLARLSAQIGPVVEKAQTGGQEVVDYAFRKAVLFLAIACAMALVTVQLNRWLRSRCATRRQA